MELQLGTARPTSLARSNTMTAVALRARPVVRTGVTCNWKAMLPELQTAGVTLRELRVSDAPSLLQLLATDEVSKFVSPPPTSVEGFERFVTWTHDMRRAGSYTCFAIVPRGWDVAVGLLQVRALSPDFSVAEWGFVLGAQFWGTGLFVESAELTVDFAVDIVGVERLEARAVTLNGRGNGALTKLGAVREATLRASFAKGGSTSISTCGPSSPTTGASARHRWTGARTACSRRRNCTKSVLSVNGVRPLRRTAGGLTLSAGAWRVYCAPCELPSVLPSSPVPSCGLAAPRLNPLRRRSSSPAPR